MKPLWALRAALACLFFACLASSALADYCWDHIGFRRFGPGVLPCPSPGSGYALYAGLIDAEAASLGWPNGAGYGNYWSTALGHAFMYSGGSVTMEFDYQVDMASGDQASVVVDATGNGTQCTGTVVKTYTGFSSGHETLMLTGLPATPGPVIVYFVVESNGSVSDEDGGYDSCGPFTVDNVALTGGITYAVNGFETDNGGWVLEPVCGVFQNVTVDCNGSGGDLQTSPSTVTAGPGDIVTWTMDLGCQSGCGGASATYEVEVGPDLFPPSGWQSGRVAMTSTIESPCVDNTTPAGTYKYTVTVYDGTGTTCAAISNNPLDPYIMVPGGGPVIPTLTDVGLAALVVLTGLLGIRQLRRRRA